MSLSVLGKIDPPFVITVRKRNLEQGNAFTPVSHSIHGGHVWRGVCGGGTSVAWCCVCVAGVGAIETATEAGAMHLTSYEAITLSEFPEVITQHFLFFLLGTDYKTESANRLN